jgi:hypothetical protein
MRSCGYLSFKALLVTKTGMKKSIRCNACVELSSTSE